MIDFLDYATKILEISNVSQLIVNKSNIATLDGQVNVSLHVTVSKRKSTWFSLKLHKPWVNSTRKVLGKKFKKKKEKSKWILKVNLLLFFSISLSWSVGGYMWSFTIRIWVLIPHYCNMEDGRQSSFTIPSMAYYPRLELPLVCLQLLFTSDLSHDCFNEYMQFWLSEQKTIFFMWATQD